MEPREAVEIRCEIRLGLRAWQVAHLRDLTPHGFKVALTETPRINTVLRIRMPGLQLLEAEVCWARDFEAGCKFAAPLSSYVFDHIVRQSRGG